MATEVGRLMTDGGRVNRADYWARAAVLALGVEVVVLGEGRAMRHLVERTRAAAIVSWKQEGVR